MEEKKQGSAKKVFKVILNVIIWLFVAFAVVTTIFAFAAQSSRDGVPTLFGKTFLTVQSNSMKPEFVEGDLIIGQRISDEAKEDLKEGDIISFLTDLDGDGNAEINTHRIVKVNKNDNGTVNYTTRGDNKETNTADDKEPVLPKNIISQYTGTKIGKIGHLFNFLQTPKGFLIAIVLPLLLFFVYELFRFIKKIIEIKNSGKKQISAADEEEIKQKAIEEYLKQQEAQKTASDAPTEEPVNEAPPKEEAPVEETPAEEAPAEEAPAEEKTEKDTSEEA